MLVLTVTNESLAEIDEALANLSRDLKRDEYGNRMDWRKKMNLIQSIDLLLEERLKLTTEKKQVTGA
jgi:hypothetical protein